MSNTTGSLRVDTFFPGTGLRKALAGGTARLVRHSLSALPTLFDRGAVRCDVLLLSLSQPDSEGRMSCGVSVDYMPSVMAQRPLVIAEIGAGVPRTAGPFRVHLSEVDYAWRSDLAPHTVPRRPGDEIDRKIARNVASLIDDGAIIQVGIGALPDLVLGELADRRNLGLHSGIITDAAADLIRAGVIDNSTKTSHRGKSVTTMAAGSAELYDFLDDNPDIEFYPCSFTHAQETLSALVGLQAVNGALEADLYGNINAERAGGRVISAPGGLPDFAAGATLAHGGASIIALRSRAPDGASAIKPALDPGYPITVSREHVDYVVTEHGVAAIRGKSELETAKALASIADPQFRNALLAELPQRKRLTSGPRE